MRLDPVGTGVSWDVADPVGHVPVDQSAPAEESGLAGPLSAGSTARVA